MNIATKLFVTALLVGLMLVPVIGELLAVPALAMIGTLWGVIPTKK